MTPEFLQEISRCLDQYRRILIFTHQRPDGDALGSSFGLRAAFRAADKEAEVYLPAEMPHRHSKLFSGNLTTLSPEELKSFDAVISLDCANPERLGKPEWLPLEQLRQNVFINIDHHAGNTLAATRDFVDSKCASASELIASAALEGGWNIPSESATAWLSGMMTDTGCFRFANTSPHTMNTAAELLKRGAALENIVNALFFSKPLKQVRFENELMNNHFKIVCNGKLAYAQIPGELLKKYDFSLKEDEGLIDLLREIDGVVIAMLIHLGSDGWKISLRSKDKNFPVGPLARSLGGGGHDLAAGATLPAETDPEKFMLEKLTALLQ